MVDIVLPRSQERSSEVPLLAISRRSCKLCYPKRDHEATLAWVSLISLIKQTWALTLPCFKTIPHFANLTRHTRPEWCAYSKRSNRESYFLQHLLWSARSHLNLLPSLYHMRWPRTNFKPQQPIGATTGTHDKGFAYPAGMAYLCRFHSVREWYYHRHTRP